MPKVIVCLSIESTYRFWLSVLGRIERPRLLRMLRLSTSAGRCGVFARRHAQPRPAQPPQLLGRPLGEAHLRRHALERDPVAADVDVRVEGLLDETEVLIAGT